MDVTIIAMAMPEDDFKDVERGLRRHGYKDMQTFFNSALRKELNTELDHFPFFASVRDKF